MSIEKTNPISAVENLQYLKIILRKWMKDLTASEFMVLMFIFDRTIGWSKKVESIRMGHFLKGVHHQGRVIRCQINMCESTIRNSLQSLKRKKYIVVHTNEGSANCYEINFNKP